MANIKISALPTYTGSAADVRWFIMNNSGNTETFKYSGYAGNLILGTGSNSFRTPNATASGNQSLAIGDIAQATGTYNVAIGYNARATSGNGNVAIGWDTIVGDSHAAVGGSHNATGQEGATLGYNNENTGNQSVSIGTLNNIGGGISIGIGYANTDNSNNRIIGIGGSNNIGSAWSVGLGYNNTLVGFNYSSESVLIGYGNTIQSSSNQARESNIIIGKSQTITDGGFNTIVNGKSNSIAGLYNTLLSGQNNLISAGEYNTIQSGSGNTISSSGKNNAIIGSSGSTISGSNVNNSNIVGGTNNTLTAALGSSVIGGQDHQLYGQWSGIFAGRQHTNNSNYSVCLGGRENDITSTSSEHCGMLAGFQNINSSTGKYNVMIGGFNSTVTGGTNIVTLALTGRTGLSQDNTTYAENVHAFRTYSTKVQTLTSGVTFTLNLNEGGKGQFYLTGASTIDITNVRDGGHTITWSSTGYTFKWKGADSTPSNNKTDLWRFEVYGTVIFGEKIADFS